MIDIDDALMRAQRNYARLVRRELKLNGVNWPIIPDRRWDAELSGRGDEVVATGYNSCLPGLGFSNPVVRYRVTSTSVRKLWAEGDDPDKLVNASSDCGVA